MPNASASLMLKSALKPWPPPKTARPMSRPIASSAVHIAASFSTATRVRLRGSESSTSIAPRSSSPRSMRLPARSGHIAMRNMKIPILNVA